MAIRRRVKKRAKKKARRKQMSDGFSAKGGINVYRTGLEGGNWSLVDGDPNVRFAGGTISIGANIAVNKTAMKQSVVDIKISEEALVGLFEAQFGIRDKSIGRLVSELKKSRETSTALLNIIDDISKGYYWIVGSDLKSIPEDPGLFAEPNDVKKLRKVSKHKWDKD